MFLDIDVIKDFYENHIAAGETKQNLSGGQIQ